MKFELHVSTDNAAFYSGRDADEYDPAPELARILRALADGIEPSRLVPGVPIRLLDVNGNRVGYAELAEEV